MFKLSTIGFLAITTLSTIVSAAKTDLTCDVVTVKGPEVLDSFEREEEEQ